MFGLVECSITNDSELVRAHNWEGSQVLLKCVRDLREIFLKDGCRLGVEINRREAFESSTLHSKAETTAATEKIGKIGHFHGIAALFYQNPKACRVTSAS